MSLVSRIVNTAVGAPFVLAGYDAAANPGPRVVAVQAAGLPNPEQLVRLNGAAMALGGAAMVAGIMPRTAALGLAASLGVTTAVGHAFWNETDPTAKKAHRSRFLVNVSLIGGLLAAARAPR